MARNKNEQRLDYARALRLCQISKSFLQTRSTNHGYYERRFPQREPETTRIEYALLDDTRYEPVEKAQCCNDDDGARMVIIAPTCEWWVLSNHGLNNQGFKKTRVATEPLLVERDDLRDSLWYCGTASASKLRRQIAPGKD
ncbi:hypothetical protein LTR97_009546 [Elasticomyces elasticus]|uniref:Uncharacterized protein n=1 Tax=Elasticomyces elasticus TaxID=574655 RepID=A0AAN7ZLT2_9PEZI|nr:hypothetical protein LTR97_009546 [Elasticomyces elasticus]